MPDRAPDRRADRPRRGGACAGWSSPSGRQFDPELAAIVRDQARILSGLDSVGTWDAVIEAEPALAVMLDSARLDFSLLAIANFFDLKSPSLFAMQHRLLEAAA